jgi:hypothetical protein
VQTPYTFQILHKTVEIGKYFSQILLLALENGHNPVLTIQFDRQKRILLVLVFLTFYQKLACTQSGELDLDSPQTGDITKHRLFLFPIA